MAVIGCGPGAMFVGHAVESQRQELLKQVKGANSEDERDSLQSKLNRLPAVMCFEQADAPGGVWRSTKKNTSSAGEFKSDTTNMYEALWCNGPKEVMEFADYTFLDHFGKDSKLPLYLPRQAVLDYILSRVTRNCPGFFEKYAQFQTRVNTVTYDATANQFTVKTTHLPTQTTTTALYDKVIWSAGQNGSGKIPGPILHPFQEAQKDYTEHQTAKGNSNPSIPPFLHASSMEQKIAAHINGRHLLLIGGSYSAEDLAFMGIKWGAKHVTVLSRRSGIDVPVSWTTNWPGNKVTVVAGYVVKQVDVIENNADDVEATGVSYTVSLKKYASEIDVIEVDETKDEPSFIPSSPIAGLPESPKSVVGEEETKTIDNVDVVICCTGYTEHLQMLDKSCYNMTEKEYQTYWNGRDIFELPKDWAMPENPMTGIVSKYYEEEDEGDDEEKKSDENVAPKTGKTTTALPPHDIPPKRDNLYPGCYVNPYSYREFVFVHNPNLMWLAANNFDAPLLALDVQAHLAVKFLTGQRQMPTLAEMKTENYEQALMEMAMPMVRYWMDNNYYNAVQKWLAETSRKISFSDAQGNRCSRYEYPTEWQAAYRQTSKWELHLLARLMQEAEYPLQLGDLHELNEMGEQFMQINWNCRNYHTCPKEGTTFRDVDEKLCSVIQSVLTGARPSPLNGRWLDMDDFMENVSDMVA